MTEVRDPSAPLDATAVHICVDMQRLFAEKTDWHMPWLERVLPNVERLVAPHPERTIFSRFVPARQVGEGTGTWKGYYERWPTMTVEALGEDMVDLVPSLQRFVPPGQTVDKHVYSPWLETDLHQRLQERGIKTLLVTGGETEVCVLATVLGAVDLGYKVVLATDALCSSADETHDALLTVYKQRYGQQVEAATTDAILERWSR